MAWSWSSATPSAARRRTSSSDASTAAASFARLVVVMMSSQPQSENSVVFDEMSYTRPSRSRSRAKSREVTPPPRTSLRISTG